MTRRVLFCVVALFVVSGVAALVAAAPSSLPSREGAGQPLSAKPTSATTSGTTTVSTPAPFRAPPAAGQDWSNEECMLCHGEADIVEMAEENPRDGLIVDLEALAGSVHADFDCIYCHEGIDDIPHQPTLPRADHLACDGCHGDITEVYDPSVHGSAHDLGDNDAATCSDCHGFHDILAADNEESSVYPFHLPATCGQCHADEGLAREHAIAVPEAYQRYVESVHGRGLLRSGLLVSAACNDCHASHAVYPSSDGRSPVNRMNVASTCGDCHEGILREFDESVHGQLLDEGNADVPACTTCHATHSIPRAFEPGFVASAVSECGNCHADKLDTYRGTLHGQANELGYAEVAACSSCHTPHHILPVDNPASSVAPANLATTCASCHPGANDKFADYIVHADPHDRQAYPLLFSIYYGMMFLLTMTLVCATAHTILWYRRARQDQLAAGKGYRREEYWDTSGPHEYVRFNVFNRVLHILVLSSFLILVATGIPLRFSSAPWAERLMGFFGGVRTAGYVHRVGAVIMLVYVGMHLGYLFYLKFGKREEGLIFGPDSLMPRKKDLDDFIGQIRWFLGKGPQPEFGRWTYWEKFDYLADAWGVIVFGTTGLILWFPVFFTQWLPGWAINVAMIVHGIEALLALSFIFTVHFFNAHLRPGKFPIDPVFLTGRITVEELKEERPLEYRQLVEDGELEKQLVGPSSPLTQHYARLIGYTALVIGLTLVTITFISVLVLLLT